MGKYTKGMSTEVGNIQVRVYISRGAAKLIRLGDAQANLEDKLMERKRKHKLNAAVDSVGNIRVKIVKCKNNIN